MSKVKPKAMPTEAPVQVEPALDTMPAEEFLPEDLFFETSIKAQQKVRAALSAADKQSTAMVAASSKDKVQGSPMGKPLFLPPTTEAARISNLCSRELLDPSGDLEPISPTVMGLQDTVKAISEGKDIAPFKENIQRVSANQPEKGDVIRSFLNQINHENLATMAVMVSNSLRVIKRASLRGDVNVSEALDIWRMCNGLMPQLTRGLGDDKAVDSITVVEKIDYHRQQVERSVEKRWEGTTPQGRELIRKGLWEIKRDMLAGAGIMPMGINPVKSFASEPEPIEAGVKPA